MVKADWADLLSLTGANNTEIEAALDVRDMKVEDNDECFDFFATKKEYKQYCNESLYTFEKRLLEWFDIKMKDEKFTQAGVGGRRARTYTMGMMIEQLFGRKWNHKIDSKYTTNYSKVLKYYCSSVSTGSWSREEQRYTNKSGYHFSISRIKNCPPYSLRLRYEKFCEQGTTPDVYNMKLPKDDLNAGHSRYSSAEKKKQKIREEAKRRWEEMQKNNASIAGKNNREN